MAKIKLSVQETLKYQRVMIIDVPEEMSDEALNAILTSAERDAVSAEDFSDGIDGHFGITVLERPDTDMDSPYDTEIESDYLE